MAKFQIQTNDKFRVDKIDIILKYPIYNHITKNKSLSVFVYEIELYVLILVCWRLRFLFAVILPFSEMLIEKLM